MMFCTKNECGGTIKITHGYRASASAQTSTGVCETCRQRYTLATIVICESDRYGKGAAALATRIAKNGNGALLPDK